MTKNKWWSKGIRFQCQQSGKCCVSRGQYGFVYLTLEDRRRLASHLSISTAQFTRKFCQKTEGYFHLKELQESGDCIFLNEKQCSVYLGRPTQCRTWPFWPEHMSAKNWAKEVASFCPGVGKGSFIPAEKIKEALTVQANADLKDS